MNFRLRTLGMLDRVLGCVCCISAVLFRPRKLPFRNIQSVLIIKPTEEGTTVEAIPALVRLRELVGVDNVYFLVLASKREILDEIPVVKASNVFSLDDTSLVRLLWSFIKVSRKIRRLGLDACLDFERIAHFSVFIARVTGCPVKIGFYVNSQGYGFRKKILTNGVLYDPHLHISQQFLTLAGLVEDNTVPENAFEIPPVPPEIPPVTFNVSIDEDISREIRSLVAGALSRRSIILLHPHPEDPLPERKWPLNKYRELAVSLLKRTSANIILIGTPEEKDVFPAITAAFPAEYAGRILSAVGKTTLHELLFLLKNADLLITSDSGPAHFAALFKIKEVVLFGPETPVNYAPLNPYAVIIQARTECRPCYNVFNNRIVSCKRNRCMEDDIRVDDVLEASLKLLKQTIPCSS